MEEYDIEEGYSHIIYEEHPARVYQIFSYLLSKGIPGLCLTSTYPKKLTKRYKIDEAEIIWISETKAEGAINPQRLDFEIARAVNRFIEANKGGTMLIDCIEFLVLSNGFDKVRKYLKRLIDTASINDITLLVSVNPDSFTKENLTTLARDFDKIIDVKEVEKKRKITARRAEGEVVEKYPRTAIPPAAGSAGAAITHGAPSSAAVEGHPSTAVAEGEKAHVADAEEWFRLGLQADRDGKYEEAILYYTKALKINPKDVRSLFNKGVDLLMLRRPAEALECFDRALKINPHDAEIWSNRGIALRALGRIEEAIECYDRALAINPNDAGVWSNKGVALRALGRIEEAIECYDRALAINPNDAGVWSNKGVALHKLGRLREAIECYDKALAIDPNRKVARINKEYALKELGLKK